MNYNTPYQIDAGLNYIFEQALTSQWEELPFPFIDPFPSPHVVCNVVDDYLQEAYWRTQNPVGGFAVQYPNPPVACFEAPSSTWNSTPLALPNCQSGRYTLRLTVEDTMGNKTDNLRWVWFDNKSIYGKIAQIGSITPCATVDLSVFSGGSPNCAVPWPAPLEGSLTTNTSKKGTFRFLAITMAAIRCQS